MVDFPTHFDVTIKQSFTKCYRVRSKDREKLKSLVHRKRSRVRQFSIKAMQSMSRQNWRIKPIYTILVPTSTSNKLIWRWSFWNINNNSSIYRAITDVSVYVFPISPQAHWLYNSKKTFGVPSWNLKNGTKEVFIEKFSQCPLWHVKCFRYFCAF